MRARLVEDPEEWRWSSYRGTAGFEKPHLSMTKDWVLGQFAVRQKEAERRYRDFVRAGIGREKIWNEVRGQSILGEENFMEELMGYLKGQKEVGEIPRSQRYADRPALGKIFPKAIISVKETRDKKIIEAVERYAYSQKEVADFLRLHYTTISRIMHENIC